MMHLQLISDNIIEAKADIEKLEKHLSQVSDRANEYVIDFIDLKNKNRIKGQESDIYYWLKKDPEELITFIDNMLSAISNTQAKRDIKAEGSKHVAQNEEWDVYYITTHEACRQYGKNTKWCITEETDFYWRRYLLQDYSFYFCIRKIAKHDAFDKLAMQCKNKKIEYIWDSEDKSYRLFELAGLNLPKINDILHAAAKPVKLSAGLTQLHHNILKVDKNKLDTNVIVPKNISIIPSQAFAKSAIAEIVFEDNNNLKTLNSGMFFNCNNLTSVKLSNGLKDLGNGIFHSCDKLEDVTLPNTLLNISPFCFKDCISLKNVNIPNNIRIISEQAFSGCSNLEEITISNPNIMIDADAFIDCPKLMIRSIPNSNAHKYAIDNDIAFTGITQRKRHISAA